MDCTSKHLLIMLSSKFGAVSQSVREEVCNGFKAILLFDLFVS